MPNVTPSLGYLLMKFPEFVGGFMLPQAQKFRWIPKGLLSSMCQCLAGAVAFPQILSVLAAELCVRCKHVLELQEWYGSPLSLCQVWFGSDFARRRWRKSSIFYLYISFLIKLLNNKVCEHHFVMMALKYICPFLPFPSLPFLPLPLFQQWRYIQCLRGNA